MNSKIKLYKHWYLITLRGILLLLLAVYAIIQPSDPKVSFIKLFELFAIASGLLLIQTALTNRHHLNWYWILFGGILDLSFGVMLWLIPEIEFGTVPLVLAIWFLYTGILQGTESLVLIHDNIKNWAFELVSGMFFFVMAFLLVAFRLQDRHDLLLIVGVFAAIQGIFIIVASFVLKEPEE